MTRSCAGPIPDPFIKGGNTRKVPFSLAVPGGASAASVEAVLTYSLIPTPEPALKDKYLATLKDDKEREKAKKILDEYTQPRMLTYRAKTSDGFGAAERMSVRRTIVPVALTAMFLVAGWLSALVFGDRIFAQQDGKAPVTMDKAFPNSNKCKRCHERVFEEWETSPLSRSIHSPAFAPRLTRFCHRRPGRTRRSASAATRHTCGNFPIRCSSSSIRRNRAIRRWTVSPARSVTSSSRWIALNSRRSRNMSRPAAKRCMGPIRTLRRILPISRWS